MAQSGFTPIQLYFSTTAAAVPLAANLAQGELAINITDGKLYYENNSGTVTLLASAAGASGDVVGPASATDNALARFDGTTGKLIQNGVVIVGDTGAVTGVTDLTASGNVTLSGGTANGVAYLNGSKVVTSGSALAFDGTTFVAKSNVEIGNSLVDANRYVNIIGAGANKDFGIQFGGSRVLWQNTGQSGLLFGVSDTEAMRLTSTGLGIGASSPAYKLDVQASGTFNVARFRGQGGSVSNYIYTDSAYWYYGDGIGFAGNGYTGRADTNTLSMQTAGTERVFIGATGNVGIGTASPSSRLSVSNSSGGNVASFTDTSSADLQINLTSGVSLLTPSTSILAFGTANTERARIDSSGNLGIGTTSPSTYGKLVSYNVSGGAYAIAAVGNDQSNVRIRTKNIGSGGGDFSIVGGTPGISNAGLAIFDETNSATRMLIDSSGNLLVGTTSATSGGKIVSNGIVYQFQTANGTSGTPVVSGGYLIGPNDSTVYAGIRALNAYLSSNASQLAFYVTAASGSAYEAGRFDLNGNLLVGTTSSSTGIDTGATRLFVVAPDSNFGAALTTVGDNQGRGIRFTDQSRTVTGALDAGSSKITFGSNSAHPLTFITGGTEKARIDTSGRLLVGTTSAMFSAKIVAACEAGSESIAFGIASGVTRASGTNYGFSLYRDNTTETNAVTFVENAGSGNNAASYVVRTNAGTGGAGVTNVSGGVALVNGATSWSSYSDLRLKHDVVPVTNAIESILKIDPIFFKWNDRPVDQQRSIGVSAQSVEKVFPELIDRSGIYDVEGGAMQVRYTELIPVLLASIQEQQAIIESLKARLDAANL